MTNCEQLIARLNDEAQFNHNHETLALFRDSEKLAQDAQSAFRTLEHIGYTNHGGEYWQPPVSNAATAVSVNHLQAENEPLTDERITEIARYWSNSSFARSATRFCTDFARAIESAHGIGGTP